MKTIKLNETMNEITEIISIAKFAAAYKLLKQAMYNFAFASINVHLLTAFWLSMYIYQKTVRLILQS